MLVSLSQVPLSVLDVACGNMRFKTFLDESLSGEVRYHAIDSCPELVPDVSPDSFQRVDIIETLLSGQFPQCVKSPNCDLVVSFGFMHHIPTFELRKQLLQGLIEKTNTGGTVAVSFWRFAQDPKLRKKAQESTKRALRACDVKLESGDYFLGWQEKDTTFRYCHSFTDEEISQLSVSVQNTAQLVDIFEADGRTGNMNTYLVLRKCSV